MILTIQFPEGESHGQYKMFRYPGGEVQVRLTSELLGVLNVIDKVQVIARITDGDIIPVAQLIDALKGATNVDVTLILPYLPYGRADRRFVPGDCHGLAVFGRLLGITSYDIVTLDAHSNQAVKYIRHLTNVSPVPIINQVVDLLDGTTSYGTSILSTGVLLPDKGSAARYGTTGDGLLTCDKIRDPETGKLSGFKVPPPEDFKCDNILIIDDICDGGATFNGIADALRESGNTLPLYLYVTHGIFSKGLENLLMRFKGIFTTDSYPLMPASKDSPRLTVIPCMPTILEEINRKTEIK